ncbi:AAA-domain-containing protein [Hypoxylon trugodes]|uniref:AAA-domain-containing protein n=1 Tax=Hypoxylon trugodes TaxID=326681 RepID=UPI00219A6268|nr:AAA-domain-containing protein [Hypoxylon trugodes]KAI1384540.1 AAA-domain-containing protein [Hypoxylon trugodes]
MAGKRKRDILDFDPTKSDSDDENFEPDADRPRSQKKSRSHRVTKPGVRKRGKYRGSDIEDDDDDLDESDQEGSFAEDDEEDEEPPINENTGRRIRKAATKHQSYKESSEEDEELVRDSDEEKYDLIKDPPKKSPRQRKLITLRVPASARKTRTNSTTHAPIGARRITRARTVDRDDAELVELTISGKHARPARGSKSKSPEVLARAARPTRSGKGIKKPVPPPVLEEDTQVEDAPAVVEVAQDVAQDVDADADADADIAEENVGQEDAIGEVVNQGQDELVETVEPNDNMDIDDDDDDIPITRKTRGARANQVAAADEDTPADYAKPATRSRRLTRKSRFRKSLQEPSSDFEPGNDSGEEIENGSDANQDDGADDDISSPSARGRRSSRGKGRRSVRRSQRLGESNDEDEVDENEVAEELKDLRQDSRSRRERRSPKIIFEKRKETRRRRGQPVNYAIAPLNAFPVEQEDDDDDDATAATPARRRRANGGGGWDHNLHTTAGALGGIGLGAALHGGPWGTGAAGNVDSDSSDDEVNMRAAPGGMVAMTPTSANPNPGAGLGNFEGSLAAAPNVGKIKNPKALADADPLGVDMNVDFSHVGGLQGHIDQLKEMVQLPLLYPELFTKFHVTPPRGVLFHGPPGTGKTLLARALANTVGIGGKKITFYMRKGADALSKWVGEAEKQLRLLFEEARKTQPSIIFFDEIDGLAPVRSSKQEQIHASIVSTLLALMDGMDGRGQVIVIGATNRPDSVDPALRRPGRFDREFYFPLPDVSGRKSIIDIHTKDWGLTDDFKMSLAKETKGYGGADLRAMCTEAALNAIQRTYPQIYMSQEKLIVDPEKITIHMTDFMLSKNKIIPSSERSAISGASPFPKPVEPLLRDQFKSITEVLDSVLPRKKKVTALDEAMFEPYNDEDFGFNRENLQQEFHKFRVYRPRLLICGPEGMGQVYISAAILHYLEGVHVQNFDLANILGDPLPVEQVLFGLFAEARRQKPSVIFIPNVDIWYESLAGPALTAFMSMIRTIQPTDSIMVVGTAETKLEELSHDLKRDLFGLSKTNFVEIARPAKDKRKEFFGRIISHIRRLPKDFPDPVNRKRRVLEVLPVAPPPPPKQLTLREIKEENQKYRRVLNVMKIHLQPIMDQIKRKYRQFRFPIIAESQYSYLFKEADPNYVRPDVANAPPRPYELATDKEGSPGLLETATGKFYYNLDSVTIETRLANAYYVTPEAFLKDVSTFEHDAKNFGDQSNWFKANELVTNCNVDVTDIADKLRLRFDFEAEWRREQFRQKEYKRIREARKKNQQQQFDAANGTAPEAGSPKLHTTTAQFQVIDEEAVTNGESSALITTNGISAPSRAVNEDVPMIDNPPLPGPNLSMQPPSQWPPTEARSIHTSTRATLGGSGTNRFSQVSAVQSIPPGVSPSALVNEASPTKTSDPSNRSSGFSTHVTNGVHHDQSSLIENSLADTQPVPEASQLTSSDGEWIHTQMHGLQGYQLPPRISDASYSQVSAAGGKPSHAPSMANLLNDPAPDESSQSQVLSQRGQPSSQQVELDEAAGRDFLEQITERTSGCTIEQLQQIFREMMNDLWKTRGESNRMRVLYSVTNVFNEAISDIESTQGILQQSQ